MKAVYFSIALVTGAFLMWIVLTVLKQGTPSADTFGKKFRGVTAY